MTLASRSRLRRTAACERGAQLVEFALVLPLLLLLLLGIGEFGLLFARYEVLTNAAREGARIAVLPGYSSADVQSRVRSYLVAGQVPTTAVNPAIAVTNQAAAVAGGSPLALKRVTVTYTYSYLFLRPIGALFGASFASTQLRAVSEMRVEMLGT